MAKLTEMDMSKDNLKPATKEAAKKQKQKKEGQGSGAPWRSKTRISRSSGAVGQDGPVCVRKGDKVERVTRNEAAKRVAAGWQYCPKSVWRATVRGASTIQPTKVAVKRKEKVVKKVAVEVKEGE